MGRHKPRKGRSAKRARAATINADDEFSKCPHSFIFNKNDVGRNVTQLITDMRRVMEPFTASKLKARKVNKLKDFVDVGMMFNVSHLMMFSKTDRGIYLRMGRLPQGPTLTFRVMSYSLVKDVVNSLKKHHMEAKQFVHHAFLIMNNFGGDEIKHKLVSSMFQNMFPAIHVDKAKLNNYKRCVVLNYNEENDTIEFRHYNIHVAPVGLSKPVRKILKSKIPDMSKCTDISDFVLKSGNLSESEAEMDGPLNEVVLPQFVSGRGNIAASKSAIRLTEIGPRMTLSLVRIVDGLCDGDVLFGPAATSTTKKRKKKKTQDGSKSKKPKMEEGKGKNRTEDDINEDDDGGEDEIDDDLADDDDDDEGNDNDGDDDDDDEGDEGNANDDDDDEHDDECAVEDDDECGDEGDDDDDEDDENNNSDDDEDDDDDNDDDDDDDDEAMDEE